MRKNSLFVFIASAASFGFYLSALSSQASHPPPSSAAIQYDAADGRDRSSDRSRPMRQRQPASLAHSTPAKPRRQEAGHTEQPAGRAAASPGSPVGAGVDNSYLNILGQIFSSRYSGI